MVPAFLAQRRGRGPCAYLQEPVCDVKNSRSDRRQGLPNGARRFITLVSEFSECATDLRLTHILIESQMRQKALKANTVQPRGIAASN